MTFDATATSTSNPSITQTQVVTFTVPEIDAVTVTGTPTSVNAIPGQPTTDTITATNVGNVSENNIVLTSMATTGLAVTGLTPLSLAVGQSATETVTLTPDPSTLLNTTLDATLTATFGPSATPATQTLDIPVAVLVPGAAAIADAAVAAGQASTTATWPTGSNDLSTALTNLVQDPTSAVYDSQAVASLTAIEGLIETDPNLSSLTTALTTDGTALSQADTASTVDAAVTQLGNDFGSLATTLSDEAAHGFTLSLQANTEVGAPLIPAPFTLELQNTGSASTTYDLSVSGSLPSGETAFLSQPSITLRPASRPVPPACPT